MDLRYQSRDEVVAIHLERQGDQFRATIDNQVYAVSNVTFIEGELRFDIQDQGLVRSQRAYIADDARTRYVAFDSEVFALKKAETTRRRAATGGGEGLIATMHGQVVSVLVSEGDAVTRGQPLVLLEAMKMEIRVTAPHEGKVQRILCAPGEIVERGQLLLSLGE